MNIATYYCNDPAAPKPNQPTHIGANVLLEWDGKLLLERRTDCGQWGLIGGRLKNGERETQGIAREVREETGISLPESAFRKRRVFDDMRIAAYRDGTVWRMVIVLFEAELQSAPALQCSRESHELRLFAPEELDEAFANEQIVMTHRDIVADWKTRTRAERE